MASDVTVTVRYKDLNLNPLEHDWEINPRLYEGIRNVDYSGMTDLVEVIDRKISDDGIGDASSQDRDEPGGPHTSRRTSQNFVLTEVRFRGEARLHALERMVLRKARPAHERVRST
jgi:hypothetical protein